jgi:hypothetical protein
LLPFLQPFFHPKPTTSSTIIILLQQSSIMANKLTILSLPFEIRQRIWRLSNTQKPSAIDYCNQASTSKTHNEPCIRSFSKIIDTIDPLHVIRHAPQLGCPGITHHFCSTICLDNATHVATQHLRNLMSKGRVVIPFSNADMEYIKWAEDAADIPGSIMVQQAVGGRSYHKSPEQAGDDAEGRIGQVMEEMFGEMGNVGRNYFATKGFLIGQWSGRMVEWDGSR